MKKIRLAGLLLALLCLSCSSKQKPDNGFDVSVTSPSFTDYHPVVLVDEAHHNMHTASGTYKPFANLLKNDGCIIEANKKPFSDTILHMVNVLVIANAKGGEHDFKERPAFTDAECSIVEKWVLQGGALLLIADHFPFGSAAEKLAERFNVHMFNGETADSVFFEGDSSFRDKLVFSKQNGLLVQNAITHGINKVVSDRGQSLSIPTDAIVLL